MHKNMILQLTKKLLRQYHIKTLESTNEILFYENGVYKSGGEHRIAEILEKYVPTILRNEYAEIISKVQRKSKIQRDEFDQNPCIINIKNGLINLQTGEFMEHTPDYLSRIQIPVFYDRTKGPVKFIQFMMDCMPDYVDRMTVLEQFASSSLSLKLEKLYMHLGSGSNGKSTFFGLLEIINILPNYRLN